MSQAAGDEDNRPALDELLDTGNQLTRVLLGASRRAPLGTDAVIPDPGHRPPRRRRP